MVLGHPITGVSSQCPTRVAAASLQVRKRLLRRIPVTSASVPSTRTVDPGFFLVLALMHFKFLHRNPLQQTQCG